MIFCVIEKDSIENPVSIAIILPQEKHYKTKILGLNFVENSLKIDLRNVVCRNFSSMIVDMIV